MEIVRHLKFKADEACVFRQDLPHKGAASQGLNDRLFFELIPTGRVQIHFVTLCEKECSDESTGGSKRRYFFVNIIWF